jgi:Tol biopolymer transport system component
MSLSVAARVGPYEIVSALGAGGMGEVFRARDTNLDRDVAIKLLPDAFANDGERLARFQREAKTLASLNHPNIAAIYGLEDVSAAIGSAPAVRALVMELVEGEDLSQRMARGPVPLDEALPIAKQIADALEAAHEQGIVHRDLKPANIKIRHDGTVKVLDFGLAKAIEQGSGVRDQGSGEAMNSPTITTPAMTMRGVILGTAAYMSPEQARGRAVDKRSDIWAFGVVVYEMLAGRRAFDPSRVSGSPRASSRGEGESVTEVLAAVLRQDIDWTALPAGTPLRLRRLLERCLDRNAKQRLRDIGEARVEIANIEGGAPDTINALVGSDAPRRAWPAWIVAAASMLALLGVSWAYFNRAVSPAAPVRLTFEPPAGVVFDAALADSMTVSPNGRLLAFTGRTPDGKRQLWVRALDSMDAHPLPGTEEPLEPFWSPDSRSIAFGAQGKLKRVDLMGGTAQTLCNAPRLVGGTWGDAGVILFVSDFNTGVSQVSAGGGETKVVTRPNEALKETSHRGPSFLPDGRHFLYMSGPDVFVGSLDTAEPKRLASGSFARYAPPGWLLLVRDRALIAQAFDAKRLELAGDPIPVVVEGTASSDLANAGLLFSVSDNGVLVSKRSFTPDYQLVWFDRDGKRTGTVGPAIHAALTMAPRLSPDGRRVALQNREPRTDRQGIWVIDLARDIPTRVSATMSQYPIWSPDSARVTWVQSINGVFGLYQKTANGVDEDELLLKGGAEAGGNTFPADWSADGRFILYYTRNEKTRIDIWALPLTGDRRPHPVLASPYDEQQAQISPDGRWIVYRSDAAGGYDIYVQSFTTEGTAGRDKWRISTGGGSQPRFRRDGQELFYLADDGQMMAVAIKTNGATFEYGAPKALFTTHTLPRGAEPYFEYDATRDGQRFLIGTILDGPNATPPSPIVVLNWTEALTSASRR